MHLLARNIASAVVCVLAPAWQCACAQETTPSNSKTSQTQTSPSDNAGAPANAMQELPGMDHDPMKHGSMNHMNAAGMFLMAESSGTAFQPSAWPMPMLMMQVGDWRLMSMAQAFVVDTQQSGPRGADKLYSTNWGMFSAVHRVGSGSLMLRLMMSLEPATITDRRYPLLFQTGETAYGTPLVDGQHPHNLFMEIAIQYARPLSDRTMWNIYYAPVGEPALGPVAYPHRASAAELPQAPLGHHWEDSTHIAYNVVTTGVSYRKMRLEASGFYGREPGENRWTIPFGPMDSWSTRFSFFPTNRWAAQVSAGRLHNPEAERLGDVVRTTASVAYVRPSAGSTSWATTLLWGQDQKLYESRTINAVLAETVLPFRRRNFLTGRYEWSQRDELFDNNPFIAEQLIRQTGQYAFNVNAFTAGYTRDIDLFRNVQTGLGMNVSTYRIDRTLEPYYGAHPWGINVFVRFRLRAAA